MRTAPKISKIWFFLINIETHQRPPLQSKPFPGVRRSKNPSLSRAKLHGNSKLTSISPIREDEANSNFLESERLLFSTTSSAQKLKKPSVLEIRESESKELFGRNEIYEGATVEDQFIKNKISPKNQYAGRKRLNFSQTSDKLNKSYLRRIVMENDILETFEDKIDFLCGEIEVANQKINELMNNAVSNFISQNFIFGLEQSITRVDN